MPTELPIAVVVALVVLVWALVIATWMFAM